MKKDIIIGTLLLILGFVVGLMCRKEHIREVTKMSQNDTIVRLDTIKYSRFELVRNTYELDIPKISRPELVYIPADSATIIYRDSIRYVTLPRQYFFTSTDDVEIWHSGIDSTIDSLNVVRKTHEITEIVSQPPSNWRFSADIGVTVGRCGLLYIAPNLSAEIGYRRWALTGEIGCNLEVQTDALLLPRGYVELGLKYSLTKR